MFRYPFTRKTTFDPVNDLSYIMSLSGYTFGIVVKKDAPWATFQEFLADAKANPGKISYGTPGAGTTLHLTMEQLAKAARHPMDARAVPRHVGIDHRAARRPYQCGGRCERLGAAGQRRHNCACW